MPLCLFLEARAQGGEGLHSESRLFDDGPGVSNGNFVDLSERGGRGGICGSRPPVFVNHVPCDLGAAFYQG